MKSNDNLNALIKDLKTMSAKENAKIWKSLATDLEKSTSKRPVVNLTKIEKISSDDETVIIAGKVLGTGQLSKKVTVAAFNFSGSAKTKILSNGSKAMTIPELMKKNPKGTNVRIIG